MSRLSTALSSATQHAMPPEFGRKWETECLNTRFTLPTLLCAGYSVKLIFIYEERIECKISVNGKILEQVNKVVYLGSMFSRDERYEMGVKGRISAGNKIKGALAPLMRR